jgi:serine acetyltransferase
MKLIGNTKIRFITNMIQHYNPNKYFTMRSKVLDTTYKSTILKLWYLYRIKKMDAFNNASFGTNFNSGAFFKTPPILPHGLNGIIIGHDCVIGKNVVIHQQVTIQHGGNIKIGDDVMIGAGAKILIGASIGNGAKIGANCVVFENIPEGATVVLPKPRIILKKKE